jgi:hypothetical protein
MAILIAIRDRRAEASGPVAGTVFFHGRPLSGGMICFTSDDWKRSTYTCAVIDENGHFRCDPEWRRDRAGRMRFRMSIVPGPRNYPLPPPATDPGGSPGSDEDAGLDAVGDGDRSPRIVRASLSSDGLRPRERSVESGRRPISSRGMILERDVRLGPEPVYIELDLRD